MRQALPIVIVAVLLTATLVDVLAAGVNSTHRHQRSGAQRHEEFSN